MAYKLTDISAAYDRPPTTTWRHIQELIKNKQFVKESPGKQYNADEVRKLQALMKFPPLVK